MGANSVLVLAAGNPGRHDDGLGPALVAALELECPPHVRLESDYQFNLEDAGSIAEVDTVIFLDAAVEGPEPFFLEPVEPNPNPCFSSHAADPAALLGLARELYGADPRAWALGVRGHDFEMFGDTFSERAQSNFGATLEFMRKLLSADDVGTECERRWLEFTSEESARLRIAP